MPFFLEPILKVRAIGNGTHVTDGLVLLMKLRLSTFFSVNVDYPIFVGIFPSLNPISCRVRYVGQYKSAD